MPTSKAAIDLIWQEETGGRKYYESTSTCRANWPGGRSGVTIGGFYDLGYVAKDELRQDWGDKLSPAILKACASVIGIHGPPARSHAREIARVVKVPYDVARDVFLQREIPKWEAVVNRLPSAGELHPDSFGALVSLAMNRGDHFREQGARYREMRNITAELKARRFADIPAEFLTMRRLWPKGGDLWDRRGHEAALFTKGLTA